MPQHKVEQAIKDMAPGEAASDLIKVLKKLFTAIEEKAKISLVMELFGEGSFDKIGSMVHRWLAECMDEGVDPANVCKGLMEKLVRSEQLKTVAHPEILSLFEDWLEELEKEVLLLSQKTNRLSPDAIATELGLSSAGANFLIAKLRKDGKFPE